MVLGVEHLIQAKIVNKRLISDLSSDVIGSFFIPNPNRSTNPKFATGTKTFTLIDNPTTNVNIDESNSCISKLCGKWNS